MWGKGVLGSSDERWAVPETSWEAASWGLEEPHSLVATRVALMLGPSSPHPSSAAHKLWAFGWVSDLHKPCCPSVVLALGEGSGNAGKTGKAGVQGDGNLPGDNNQKVKKHLKGRDGRSLASELEVTEGSPRGCVQSIMENYV